MQKLTVRGIKLANYFREIGYEVIESYPGAAQDILGIPRKRIDLPELETDLRDIGIKPCAKSEAITHDEIDALVCALVGFFYLAESYEALGNEEEGYLSLPVFENEG
jgi:predicted nuclease with RNAse H fold